MTTPKSAASNFPLPPDPPGVRREKRDADEMNLLVKARKALLERIANKELASHAVEHLANAYNLLK